MSNVVRFPKAPKQNAVRVNFHQLRAKLPESLSVKGVLTGLLLVVRLPVFLLMYWLRLPVIFICNLVSIPMLLAWLFAMYAFPDKSDMVWGFGIVSFSAFAIGWAYDYVLMMLAPQDMVMTL